jgi:hypothetical protein
LRPSHARQRGEERTVAREPLLPGRVRIDGRWSLHLRAQAFDERFEPRRIEQMLGFGKTAQTGVVGGNFRLHPLQLRGGRDAAQRGDDGIDQREEKETQVVGARQPASGIGPGRGERKLFQERDEAGAKISDQLPLLEILLGKVGRAASHARMKAPGRCTYKLQWRDRTMTKP